jgi:hypothetical protein
MKCYNNNLYKKSSKKLQKMPKLSPYYLSRSTSIIWLSICAFNTFSVALNQGNKMRSIRNDGQGGRGVTVIPTSGSYSNVVVWLHGLGKLSEISIRFICYV